MWLRDPIDIEVSRSADIPIGMQFWDEYADAPLDITGYQFSLLLAKNEGDDPFISAFVENTDPINGNIDFVILGGYFSDFPGIKEVITTSYQIKATDADNNSVIAARGAIIVTPGLSIGSNDQTGVVAVWSSEDW